MTPNGSIDEQMAAFATKSQRKTQSLEHASRALTVSKNANKLVDFVKLFLSFLVALIHPLAQKLLAFMHALPPLNLALLSINALWEMLFTLTFGRESKRQKTIKSGLAITTVTLTIIAFVFPATALILATIGVGLTLIKTFAQVRKHRKEYLQKKCSLIERRLTMDSAQVERLHPKFMRKLEAQIAVLEKQTALAKRTYRASWIQLGLMTFTIAGTICLFFPPIAPIGLGLLTASIIAGVGVQLSNWALPKLFAGKPLLPTKEEADGDPEYFPSENAGMTVRPGAQEEIPAPKITLTPNIRPLVTEDNTEDSTEDFLDVENFARAISPQAKPLHQEHNDDQDDDEGEGESQPTDSIEPKLTP